MFTLKKKFMVLKLSSSLFIYFQLTSKACQVVSLGAGFDTLYWNLKDEGVNPTSFIEVDFSAITSMKIAHIRRGKALLEKISNEGIHMSHDM